jgi:ABC-type uncharacterized transport system permease subunit
MTAWSSASTAATAAMSTAVSLDAWLMVTGVVAVLAYVMALALSRELSPNFMRAVGVAWAAHALALLIDVFGSGQGARFGFAPALSATVWLVVGAHLVERRSLTLEVARRLLVALGLVSTALAVAFPGVARQAESPWAPLHWSLALIAYGLLGAAVVHAWLLNRADQRLREGGGASSNAKRPGFEADAPVAARAVGTVPVMTLERLTFRFVEVGFVVLTVAIVLGAWFAMQSTQGWQWFHHKTVFALAGWGTFAMLVAGRHLWGWRGRRATRWVYVGAALLALAYMGTRFVVEVLLGRGA